MDLDTPTLPSSPGEDDERAGRGLSIGRFLVLGSLGVGGMATVVSAYDPQLDRKVALKLLRGEGWNARPSEATRLRVVREAQAMARLNHPNVVAVYEVVFDDQSGYVVMEQIVGSTLREWLDARERRFPEILDVLLAAGTGLAAAHRAGLVHHDFKPQNVLVGEDGRARVSDFGLAGDGRPGSGTPGYMAPEQQRAGEVDARADQFAFCVTFWEALHGARPPDDLTAPASGRKAPRWVYRALRRGLARDPAARWPSMDALLATLRRRRALAPRAAVAASLLVVAALAFFAGGRRRVAVPSCQGAAARLAGVWDDARKREVHAAFAATGLPYAEAEWRAASERIDAYTTGWAAMHTEACRATHVEGRQSAALLDLRMECLEGQRARLASLLEVWRRGHDRKTVEAAVAATEKMPPLADCADAAALLRRTPAPADPALAARVAAARRSVAAAETLRVAGRIVDAAKAAAAARVEAEATYWPQARAEAARSEGLVLMQLEDPRTEQTLLDAARLAWEAGDERLASRALAGLADWLTSDPRTGQRALLVASLAEGARAGAGKNEALRIDLLRIRGQAHYMAGDLTTARRELEEARQAATETFGAEHHLTCTVVTLLVLILEAQGEYPAARALAEENLATTIALHGEDHPLVATQLNNLGMIYSRLADQQGSARAFRRSLAIKERIEGEGSIRTASTMSNLGGVEMELGHIAEAEALHVRALAIQEKALGPEHPQLAYSLTNLALVRREQARYDEALALHMRALAIREKANPESANVALNLEAIGWLHADKGDPAAALVELRRSLQMREKVVGPDHPATQSSRSALAWVLADVGRCDEAVALAGRAIAALAETDPETFTPLVARGRCELAAGKPAQAVASLQRAVALADKHLPPNRRGLARWPLARALWAAGQRPEAVASARQAEQELATSAMGARDRGAARAWLAVH